MFCFCTVMATYPDKTTHVPNRCNILYLLDDDIRLYVPFEVVKSSAVNGPLRGREEREISGCEIALRPIVGVS